MCLTNCYKSKCRQDWACAPWKHLPWWHFQTDAINCFIMRGNLLYFPVCRLVMYIERDSRKTTPGKEQQSSNEYLSKCLDLLIRHIVQELPRILGKSEARAQAPCWGPFCAWAFRLRLFFTLASPLSQASAVTPLLDRVVPRFQFKICFICFYSYFASVAWLRQWAGYRLHWGVICGELA